MKTKQKYTAVIYVRTSQDSIADSGKENKISISEQIKECKDTAKKYDYKVLDICEDRNMSSVTYPSGYESIAEDDDIFMDYMDRTSKTKNEYYRNGLGQVMNYLPKIDFVLVRDETRLMRPLIHSQLLSKIYGKFQKNNVKIHCCLGNRIIDPKNFQDAFMCAVISMTEVNSMLEKIEASRRSLKEKRNSGYLFNSMTLFGYKSVGKQQVEINQKQADVVKKIYAMILDDKKTIGQVVRYLNDLKIPTHQGKEWTHRGLLKILKRLVYTGRQWNTEGEDIPCIPLQGKEIIPLNRWKKMQRILQKNKKFPKSETHEVRPLTGLCFCAYCGKRLYVCKTKQFDENIYNTYYECTYGSKHKTNTDETIGCRMVRIRDKRPNDYDNIGGYSAKLERNGLREIILPLLARHVLQSKKNEILNQGLEDELENLHNERSRINEKLELFSDMLDNEEMDINLYRSRVKKTNEKLKICKKKIQELEEQIDNVKENVYDREEFVQTYFKIQTNTIDPMIFRDMARSVIAKIEVAAYSVRIHFIDGDYIDIERVPITSSRALPNAYLFADVSKDFGVNSQVTIHYYYKSYFKKSKTEDDIAEKIIYENDAIKVITHGFNPKPHEYLKKRKQRKRLSHMKPVPEYVYTVFQNQKN